MINRRHILAGLAATSVFTGPARAEVDLNTHFTGLLSENDAVYDRSIAALRDCARSTGGEELIHGLILTLRYTHWRDEPIRTLLAEITGETTAQTWFDWMLWQEARPEIAAHAGYMDQKRAIFYGFDPRFAQFLNDKHIARSRIRLPEITWGGVTTDGIPGLVRPKMIAARDAEFMVGSDAVLGVSVNGDTRAYPLRILAWHEMLNDIIGGVPVALPYCTLCASGILFETQIDDDEPLTFGTSGLLFRSNKLMWDDRTRSLWNQYTGEPVLGPLAKSGIVLKSHPVVVEPWIRWVERNPDSTVLSLDTGFTRNYASGYFYDRYIRSDDLIFPARADEQVVAKKDVVFGIRSAGGARAWPLSAFEGGRVINDRVGLLNVVLIGDRLGDTVRAYDRGDVEFNASPSPLVANGTEWQMTEDALIGPDGQRARRIAGRTSYWFAWDNYEGATSGLYNDR